MARWPATAGRPPGGTQITHRSSDDHRPLHHGSPGGHRARHPTGTSDRPHPRRVGAGTNRRPNRRARSHPRPRGAAGLRGACHPRAPTAPPATLPAARPAHPPAHGRRRPHRAASARRRWTLPRQVPLGELEAAAGDAVAPLPALVTIGTSDAGQLLVNLEAAGLAALAGPASATRPLLHAMAVELATAASSGFVQILLVGFGAELDRL